MELGDLWQALHLLFNSAQDYQVDSQLLEEIPGKETTKWAPFLKKELIGVIENCNNFSTPGLAKLS